MVSPPQRGHRGLDDSGPPTLGEFEQLVLIALLRLGPDAYGAIVRREIEARAGRKLAISAVYTTLERLEQKGLVRSWIGEPTAQRGGRRRKHFELLPLGARALKVAYKAFAGMTAGLEHRLKTL
jgi:DNA-binding PadR family transcriptional regulator